MYYFLTQEPSDDTKLQEPEKVNLFIDNLPNNSISRFLAWDIEREHGDLGLELRTDS